MFKHSPQPVTCQKLIYGGRLLLDHSTLSEAVPTSLNTPEEDDSIVIHLVAYERSKSVPSTGSVTGTAERPHASASSSSVGARGRQGAGGQETGPSERGERAGIPEQPSQRVVCAGLVPVAWNNRVQETCLERMGSLLLIRSKMAKISILLIA